MFSNLSHNKAHRFAPHDRLGLAAGVYGGRAVRAPFRWMFLAISLDFKLA